MPEAQPTCRCVACDECRGSGTVWLDVRGAYLGASRCDDLDDPTGCDECDGTGVIDECYACATEGGADA